MHQILTGVLTQVMTDKTRRAHEPYLIVLMYCQALLGCLMYINAILNISVSYNIAGKAFGNVLMSNFYTRNFHI